MICPNCRTTNPGTLFCFNCQAALPTSGYQNNSAANQGSSAFSIADLLQATENDFLAATAKTANQRTTPVGYGAVPAPNFGAVNQNRPPQFRNSMLNGAAPTQFGANPNPNYNQYAPPFAGAQPYQAPLTNDYIQFRDEYDRPLVYKLAGFFRRFIGAVIDYILMVVLIFAIWTALIIFGIDIMGAAARAFQVGTVIAAMFLMFLILFLVVCILPFFYHVFRVGVYGQTLGHRITGIEVVNKVGKRPGFGRAFLRAFYGTLPSLAFFIPGVSGMDMYNFATLVILLGMLWSLFDKHKQGLHDKLAGTYVVITPR